MMEIRILDEVGEFAEDKDVAARIRSSFVEPAAAASDETILNFEGVTLVTQSFVHALVSSVLRRHGERVLETIVFKGCTSSVKGIVETVVQYSLETMDD